VKKLKTKYSGLYDLTLIWNTDGIALGGSDFHLWPILYSFSEIPPRLRAYLLCVSQIWYDKRDPPMEMFLKPFKKWLMEIHKEGGVTWRHPTTAEIIKSQVVPPAAVADAPARAMLQNVKRFNSINGCNTCELTCQPAIVKGKVHHYYVYEEEPAKLRSGKRMRKQGEIAGMAKDCSVKGVKGISPADGIPELDAGVFVFPEYMHSLCLVVVLTFTLAMISFDGNWRLQRHMKEINNLISSLKVPDFLKIPQKLSSIKKF